MAVAVGYAVVGGLWILFSDQALHSLLHDPALLLRVEMYKGWAYVLVTAAVLYFVLRGRWRAASDQMDQLEE